MKKACFLLLTFLLIFYSQNNFVYASLQWSVNNIPGKHAGGFYILDGTGGGTGSKSYIAGGTAGFDWRDFEPVEGQYNWDILTKAEYSYTGWLETWKAKMENRTTRPSRGVGQTILEAVTSGKTVRLKMRTTDGAIPLWLYGGEGAKEGKVNTTYGTTCAYYDGQIHCNPSTDIAYAVTYPLFPSKEDNAYPVWWNPVFQQKLQKTLKAIGDKIEREPNLRKGIEFIEASVGNFGEMIIWGKSSTWNPDSQDIRMWKEVGYTNAKYAQSVLNILGFYMEAFPKIPVALSFGTGLYASPTNDGSGIDNVLDYVLDEGITRWGGRLYLKHAGYGGTDQGNTFREFCPSQTKCIYESFGGISGWKYGEITFPFYNSATETQNTAVERLTEKLSTAITGHTYLAGMWTADFDLIMRTYPFFEPVFTSLAPKLQPQIAFNIWNQTHPAVEFSVTSIPAGSAFNLATRWINQSEINLVKMSRQLSTKGTYKDVPDTYPLYFDLINNSGTVVFRTFYYPSKGTQEWTKTEGEIVSTDQIYLPGTVPVGEYTARIGIPLSRELNKFWRIGGTESSEGDGPYKITKLNSGEAQKITVTTAVNNAAPTPSYCPRVNIGNVNCDQNGDIDMTDLTSLVNNWGNAGTASDAKRSDMNKDNKVDMIDTTILLDNWGIDWNW